MYHCQITGVRTDARFVLLFESPCLISPRPPHARTAPATILNRGGLGSSSARRWGGLQSSGRMNGGAQGGGDAGAAPQQENPVVKWYVLCHALGLGPSVSRHGARGGRPSY